MSPGRPDRRRRAYKTRGLPPAPSPGAVEEGDMHQRSYELFWMYADGRERVVDDLRIYGATLSVLRAACECIAEDPVLAERARAAGVAAMVIRGADGSRIVRPLFSRPSSHLRRLR